MLLNSSVKDTVLNISSNQMSSKATHSDVQTVHSDYTQWGASSMMTQSQLWVAADKHEKQTCPEEQLAQNSWQHSVQLHVHCPAQQSNVFRASVYIAQY